MSAPSDRPEAFTSNPSPPSQLPADLLESPPITTLESDRPWLARPERIRDAGVILFVLGLISVPAILLAGLRLVGPSAAEPGVRTTELPLFLFKATGVAMQLWLGLEIVGRRPWAIWCGLLLQLALTAHVVVSTYQGLRYIEELRSLTETGEEGEGVPFALLVGELASSAGLQLVPIAACIAALYACYSNRRWLPSSRPTGPAVLGLLVISSIFLFGGTVRAIQSSASPTDLTYTGGTVLVYNVDSSRGDTRLPEPRRLIAALQHRFQSMGLQHRVIVRPRNNSQFELLIRGGRSDSRDVVRRVRETVWKKGTLEFCIVANGFDDAEAIAAAQALVADPANTAQLASQARRGLPPLVPKRAFQVRLATGTFPYTYQWTRIGPSYLKDLGLDNAAADQTRRALLEEEFAEGQAVRYQDHLFLRRKIPVSARITDQPHEYFLLLRRSEPGKGITGQYLVSAKAILRSRDRRPGVEFQLDDQGGELLYDLTARNAPENHHRHIAILLDDQVEAAPSLNARIGKHGIIEGNYTQEEVRNLVEILRVQPLPAALEPEPIDVLTVKPRMW